MLLNKTISATTLTQQQNITLLKLYTTQQTNNQTTSTHHQNNHTIHTTQIKTASTKGITYGIASGSAVFVILLIIAIFLKCKRTAKKNDGKQEIKNESQLQQPKNYNYQVPYENRKSTNESIGGEEVVPEIHQNVNTVENMKTTKHNSPVNINYSHYSDETYEVPPDKTCFKNSPVQYEIMKGMVESDYEIPNDIDEKSKDNIECYEDPYYVMNDLYLQLVEEQDSTAGYVISNYEVESEYDNPYKYQQDKDFRGYEIDDCYAYAYAYAHTLYKEPRLKRKSVLK